MSQWLHARTQIHQSKSTAATTERMPAELCLDVRRHLWGAPIASWEEARIAKALQYDGWDGTCAPRYLRKGSHPCGVCRHFECMVVFGSWVCRPVYHMVSVHANPSPLPPPQRLLQLSFMTGSKFVSNFYLK